MCVYKTFKCRVLYFKNKQRIATKFVKKLYKMEIIRKLGAFMSFGSFQAKWQKESL